MTRRSPFLISFLALCLGLSAAGCDRLANGGMDPTQVALITANAPFPTYMAQTAEAAASQPAPTQPPAAASPKAATPAPATAAPTNKPNSVAGTGVPPATPLDTAAPAVTGTPAAAGTETPSALPPEALLIQSPGPLSRLTSPITITGLANQDFAGHVTVQLDSDAASGIDIQPATVEQAGASEPGDRGTFTATLNFPDSAVSENARITVLALSPRDGHVVHLATVPVALVAAGGQADIKATADHADDIVLQAPAEGDVETGGHIHVAGVAAPTFEQGLAIKVLDSTGAAVGTGVVTIGADAGQTGPFAVDVTYTVTEAQPGTVQVYSTSAKDGAILHLASVEVSLQP